MLITVPNTPVTLQSLITAGGYADEIANTSAARFNVIIQNLGSQDIFFESVGGLNASTTASVKVPQNGSVSLVVYKLDNISLIATTSNTDVRVDVNANY